MFLLYIGSNGITICGVFLEVPSIINENARNVFFHSSSESFVHTNFLNKQCYIKVAKNIILKKFCDCSLCTKKLITTVIKTSQGIIHNQ